MTTRGYLGIDAGTQGLSVLFADASLHVLATGYGQYEMLPGLESGCYQQQPSDWESALSDAMIDLRAKLSQTSPDLSSEFEVLAIGISGQMHGEVLVDQAGQAIGPARLWCDRGNAAEGEELTNRFGVKIPKRMTIARWLWTIRHQAAKSKLVSHLTTPAGWLAFRLTGQWKLGIGDASGIFPIDQSTLDYDSKLLQSFDTLVADRPLQPLNNYLPTVCLAGEDAGSLDETGARILGLPIGIPVAAAEGDQPASLAGSMIATAGMVSVSFGTSVCANSVGDRSFVGVSPAIDHFCAPDGKPINMVFLRNGTTFMNAIVEMFGATLEGHRNDAFAAMMPQVLKAAADCGGLLALPFMDDEPGLGIQRGGTAMLFGIHPTNATPGNAVKAALLSTMFNLRLGCEALDQQNFPRQQFVLSGGLTKTPDLAQILADVFETPVTLLNSATEGCAFGAALLAKFRFQRARGTNIDWDNFLIQQVTDTGRQYFPSPVAVAKYKDVYTRYKLLFQSMVHPAP